MCSQPAMPAKGALQALTDITVDNLLRLEAGERLWKLYCFRTEDHTGNLRHHVYTKLKTDGRLSLVTFATCGPGGCNGAGRPEVRSNIARVPDLSVQDLERIVAAMRRETGPSAVACDELDLSACGTLQEQIARLRDGG